MKYVQFAESISFFSNSLKAYIWAAIIFIAVLLILKFIQSVAINKIAKIAAKTKTQVDDIIIEVFKDIKKPFYIIVAIYFAAQALVLPEYITKGIRILTIIVIVYETIRGLQKLINYSLKRYFAVSKEPQDDDTEYYHRQSVFRLLRVIFNVVLWTVGLLMVLSNLGFNITSLVASLGIGGIAVALALQNILGDLFSSFSLYLDKPFQAGDFIVIGNDMGVVKKIGLKTTRITTLQGEELVISNQELTSARIQNFKRMQKRRVVFDLGVTYGTDTKKLEQIPEIVKKIIGEVKDTEFDRCHFKAYGDSNLLYETVFYVTTADYNYYMDILQSVNLGIYQAFEKEKIEFAFPTQTVFVKK